MVSRQTSLREALTGAEIAVSLCIKFGYDRADNSVGMPASITITDVWCETPSGDTLSIEYDEKEMESLCWQWLADQEPPYWEHEE